MRSFVVSKVLVVNEKGEVLAIRRSQTDDRRPGEWDFPGGWVEADEDTLTAVKREAVEEAGIDLKDPQLVFAFSEMTTKYGSGTWLLYVDHISGDPKVTLSYEHDMHAWKRPEELLKEITYERQQKMLTYVLENKLLEKE
jgi:8-oxo-dGTP diphosphatase